MSILSIFEYLILNYYCGLSDPFSFWYPVARALSGITDMQILKSVRLASNPCILVVCGLCGKGDDDDCKVIDIYSLGDDATEFIDSAA